MRRNYRDFNLISIDLIDQLVNELICPALGEVHSKTLWVSYSTATLIFGELVGW